MEKLAARRKVRAGRDAGGRASTEGRRLREFTKACDLIAEDGFDRKLHRRYDHHHATYQTGARAHLAAVAAGREWRESQGSTSRRKRKSPVCWMPSRNECGGVARGERVTPRDGECDRFAEAEGLCVRLSLTSVRGGHVYRYTRPVRHSPERRALYFFGAFGQAGF